MDDTNSFSFFDQLRPCLNTFFFCFGQSSSLSSTSLNSYFPDSDHAGLLEEQEDLSRPIHSEGPVSAYHFQSNSQLSRWELLISWLSSKTLDRLSPKPPDSFDNDLETSALGHGDQADALLLDDISIALQARSLHRKSFNKLKSNAITRHQPQPVPSPSVTCVHHKRSQNPEHDTRSTHHQLRPKGSQTSAPVKKMGAHGSLEDSKHKLPRDLSPSTFPNQEQRKSRSKSSKQSSSGYTDETVDSEQSSMPSLITSRTTTTTTSSSNPSSDRLKLNVEIIKFIHQKYNYECRRLYGRDLSRIQIQQLYDYLISTRFDDPVATPLLPSSAVTGAAGPEPDSKRQHHTDDATGGVQDHMLVPGPAATRPPVEIESLKRIQLSSTEFLQAIKQTKSNRQQPPQHLPNTKDAGHSLPIDDPFEAEIENDLFAPISFLDWFTKGSQLLSSGI